MVLMRKLSFVFGIIVMFAGVSVSSPKNDRTGAGTRAYSSNIIIQDDEGGGYFSFDGRWGTCLQRMRVWRCDARK